MSSSFKIIEKKFYLREVFIVLALLFVYNNFTFKKEVVINADGRGYYEYLPALFIYDDMHFGYLDTLQTDYYDLEQMKAMYHNPLFEKPINKYFAGTALLQSPFFAVAHAYTKFGQSEYKADGFSRPYQRAILFGAIFYLFVGFVFLRKLLQTYELNGWWIAFIQFALLFATPLFTYTMYDPAYSHIYSFTLIAGFLYVVRKFATTSNPSDVLWTFIFLGLITIVRPVNILVVLFVPFLVDSGKDLILKINVLFLQFWKFSLLGLMLFGAILCVQFYISYLQTGNPFNYNYGEEGFNFLAPRFSDFLFSYHKGFFLWTPWWFMLLILGALFWIKTKMFYHLITFFGAFVLISYVFSSWSSWSYGGSFGARPMVDFYAAFALAAIPIYRSCNKLFLGIIVLLSIPLAVINLIQSVQYQKAIIHWDGMDKDKYWQVFLDTNEKYSWYFWRVQMEVGKKQAEVELIENLIIKPTDYYEIKNIELNCLDSLSKFGQFVFVLDKEADNEYVELRMYNAENVEISYDLQRLFNRQEGNTFIYSYELPDDKLNFSKLSITFRNVREPLNIKKGTFSTHYSLY